MAQTFAAALFSLTLGWVGFGAMLAAAPADVALNSPTHTSA